MEQTLSQRPKTKVCLCILMFPSLSFCFCKMGIILISQDCLEE